MRMRNERKKARMLKRLEWFLGLISVIALILLIVQVVQSNSRNVEERKSTEQFAVFETASQSSPSISESTLPSKTDAPSNQSQTQPPSTNYPSVLTAAEKLLAENKDFVGMIGFEDMALYVCQADDNVYYASHRFDGSEDAGGMIYLDFRCSLWPMSDNMILYGHNMRDGSRFGKLRRFTNQEYLIENANIRFATLYEICEYVPIAVFYTSVDPAHEDYFDFAQVAFEDEAAFDCYIQEVRQRSLFDIPVDVEYGDSLLTLATCSEEYDGGRIVVVCKQISR